MRYFLSILLWGVFACHVLSAQNNKIDSLKHILKLAVNDTARIQALKNVSWEYLNSRSNMPLAKTYIDSVLLLSQKIEHQRGIAIANYQYGVLERQKGNYDAALAHFDVYINMLKRKKMKKK